MINNLEPFSLKRFSPSPVFIEHDGWEIGNEIITALVKNYNSYINPDYFNLHDSSNTVPENRTLGDFISIGGCREDIYSIKKPDINNILEKGKVPVTSVSSDYRESIKNEFEKAILVLILPALGEEDTGMDKEYLNKFDIVIHTDTEEKIESILQKLDSTLQAYLSTSHFFPLPRVINDTNTIGYGKVAAEFSEEKRITTKNFHDLSNTFFQNAIDNYVKNGTKCLEIGPGQGWLKKNFVWPEISYTAVDISSEMLEYVESDKKINSSINALAIADREFDVIFSSLGDPFCFPTALCEIRRVLKEDGVFVFSAPSHSWIESIRQANSKYKTQFVLESSEIAEVYSFTFSIDTLAELFRLCGLEPIMCQVAFGRDLPSVPYVVSPAFNKAADALGCNIGDLPVVNMIVARKIPYGL